MIQVLWQIANTLTSIAYILETLLKRIDVYVTMATTPTVIR